MKLINRKNVIWGVFLFIYVLITYCVAVVGDWAIKRVSTVSRGMEAQEIIKERRVAEDAPMRLAALNEGYSPMFFPTLVHKFVAMKDIVKKYEFAPLGPQPNTKIYFCNEGYGMIKYKTDRYGFRNEDSVWDHPVEVALVGDSFAHGACVPEEQSIQSILSQHKPTVNLGTWGNNPFHYTALLKSFVPKANPEKIILIFYANDNNNFDEESTLHEIFIDMNNISETEEAYSSDRLFDFFGEAQAFAEYRIAQDLNLARPSGDFTRRDKADTLKNHLSLHYTRNALRALLFPNTLNELPFSSKLALDTLKRVCEENGCVSFVAYIPNSEFWDPQPEGGRYAQLLRSYSEEIGIRFLDLTDVLRPLGRDAYAVKGPHLSPLGYGLAADEILNFIQ